jgi:hypothetical protein
VPRALAALDLPRARVVNRMIWHEDDLLLAETKIRKQPRSP